MTYPGYSGPTPIFDGENWSNVTGPDSIRYTQYDTDGHLLKSIDGRGTEADYAYTDPDGALTDVQYPATPDLNHQVTYDQFGRTSAVMDGSGSTQFGTGSTPGYDDTGHILIIQTTYTGLPAKTLSYSYYSNGSRQSMVTPAVSFAYSYDGDGRLSSLTNPFSETSQWTYQDNDWLNTQQLGKGVTTTYAQNPLGQLTNLATRASDTTLLSEFGSMAYDGVGNRTSVTGSLPATPSYSGQTSYQYDQKDQLTQEQSQRSGGYTNGFGYDPAGNATTFRGSGTNGFGVDNQITGSGYTYDGNGNPTVYKGAAITYDAEDHPTAFGSQMTAGYTGSGLRAWKGNGTGASRTYFLYDGAAPVCELDSTGTVTATNTFGGAGMLSRHTSNGSTFYTFDERGNVAQRLNSTGTVTSCSMYDAYGASATAAPDPFGFGGQFGYYTDSETGLQLCSHRYYDSGVGRFLTRDPLGYAGGLNLYAYCANNPINSADPTGFNPQNDGGNDPPWYDGLANDADNGTNAQKDALNNFWAGDPTHLIPTLANSALDLGNGLLHFPHAIGHLGEGTGTFAGDPTLANSAGVFGDAATAASVLLPFLAPEAGAADAVATRCFVAGTLVQMADGATKPIEKIKQGDTVWSRNPSTGKTEAKKVTRTFVHQSKATIVLHFNNGEAIEATLEHPFYVDGKGFVRAGQLAVGNSIVTRAGPSVQIERIEKKKKTTTVYNFEVQGNHTYFVGTTNGGIWVHNDCGAEDLANKLDDNVFFHYTNDAGLKGAMDDGMLKAGMKNQVWLTQQMLSPEEAENQLFIGAATHAGRGENLIAIQLSDGAGVTPGKPGELIYAGSLRFDQHQVLYSGPNPFH